MATRKKEAVEQKSNKSSRTRTATEEARARGVGGHTKLPPHDGPPKEPDPADITAGEPAPVGEDSTVRKPRSGKKTRPLTDSDRIAILEHRFEALGRQLRQHGIHVNPDVAVALTED
jgi:hypothetical protein